VYIPRNGIAGLYRSSFSVFWGNSVLISKVDALIYNPTNSVQGFIFPTSLSVFVVLCFLDDSHSDWSEMESQCSLDVYFPDVPCIFYLAHCIPKNKKSNIKRM
jgi:hypothetical protein